MPTTHDVLLLKLQATNLRSLAVRLRAACLLTESILYELRADRLEVEADRMEGEL